MATDTAAEASSSSADAEIPRPHSTPWREPKLEMPSGEVVSNLPALVNSPRFIEAANRYGVTEPKSLLPVDPRTFKGGGVEAALFARQEKRRLVDLGGVLMERQRILEKATEVQRPKSRRRPKSAAPDVSVGSAAAVPAGTGANENAADAAAPKQDAMIAKQLRTIDEEKKRTKMEMISLVESEAEKQMRRDMEIEYQRQLEEQRKAAMIADDLQRRKRINDARSQFEERQNKFYNNLGEKIEGRRQRQRQQTADHEERMAMRTALARQELKRREEEGARHAKECRDRMEAARAAADAVVVEKHRKMEEEAQRRAEALAAARWTPVGKVVPVIEGPKGAKIKEVKRRELEMRQAKNFAMLNKMEEERLRAEAHAEMRSMGLALRREATKERMRAFEASKTRAKVTEAIFKQDTLERIDQGSQNVAKVHSNVERLIQEQRKLSNARDHEKAQCVDRVQRSRDHTTSVLRKKQKATEDRISTLLEKRAQVKHASRTKVNNIHFARLHLTEELSLSTVDPFRTLRSNKHLLNKLGVDMATLEEASSTLKQSLSAPALSRPATSDGSTPVRSRRATGHVQR